MVRAKRRAKPGNAAIAIGYIRVSTDEQRLGPKGQAKELSRWAEREGVTLAAVFFDHGVSGAVPFSRRPGLLAAVAALGAAGAGVLVASKRDRFARGRDVMTGIESETSKAGGVVRTADGSSDREGSAGMLQMGMEDLLSEYERARIRERTTAALAVKKARGERVGSIPYGSRLAADGRTLEPHPTEQTALAVIRGLRAEGLPLRTIVDRLNAGSIPPRGERWHLSTVVNVLRATE